ncbi:hypothetical protein GALL_176050 [mine drainage metagenome]|uniref:Lipoprotein n=1 Tax=mine drainage metagenome TaxID=410659 RepID=A0A1J5S8G4_9ZZZZ
MTSARKILVPFASLLLLTVLAACYLPNHFKSEIRLGANGDYAISFYGDLIWAPLYRAIAQGKISPEDAAKENAAIEADLRRDPAFKSIEPLGQGRFKVAYERQGHLGLNDMVTFVRRNAIILELTSKPDGRIIVNGNTLRPGDAQSLTSAGMNVQGQFRIITNGLVKEQNASSIRNYDGYLVYIWDIENAFSPAPHFVMQREGVFPQGGKTSH